VVEAGDILAGDDSVRRCFVNGPNTHLTVLGQINIPFIREARILQKQIVGVQSRADRLAGDFQSASILNRTGFCGYT